MHFDYKLITVFHDIPNGFHGNISAVIMTPQFPLKKTMQSIAADLNQPATTFLKKMPGQNSFEIRWFAPDVEIDLCGHGSLAAAAFLDTAGLMDNRTFLKTKENTIQITKEKPNEFSIFLQKIPLEKTQVPDKLEKGLGKKVAAFYIGSGKELVLMEDENAVLEMQPDFRMLRKIEYFGYTVTAQGKDVDFVSRTFVPKVKQLEDHATGSSHAVLAPFWSERLQKQTLTALQLSPRGGYFQCKLEKDRVRLTGKCKMISSGVLFV